MTKHGVLSSNYTLDGDMQRRVLAVVEAFASDIEIYSIDESFVDLTPFADRDLTDHVNGMRDQVRRWTTIPTCVGIGQTKTLAKLANATAKRNPLFAGVADLRDQSSGPSSWTASSWVTCGAWAAQRGASWRRYLFAHRAPARPRDRETRDLAPTQAGDARGGERRAEDRTARQG